LAAAVGSPKSITGVVNTVPRLATNTSGCSMRAEEVL
jgi:hypothetical protein